MEEKAKLLKERFEQRQQARTKDLQKKKADIAAKTNENETVEVFNKTFLEETDKIEKLIASLGGTETGLSKSEVNEKFDELKKKIQYLQKYITNSVMFLPSYDVRQAQQDLDKLNSEIDEKRQKLIPRKRFAFKQRAKGNGDEAVRNENSTKENVPEVNTSNENEDAFGFHDRNDAELTLLPEDCRQKDIKLSNLAQCTVKIYGCPSALHVNNLKNCTIICGPVSRSIFVSNCTESKFSLACQQLRIHTTVRSVFNIHVTGKAIIEDCSELGFAPYNWKYPTLPEDFSASGLNTSVNKWDEIDDFNWLKFDEHSPNWYSVPKESRTCITEE